MDARGPPPKTSSDVVLVLRCSWIQESQVLMCERGFESACKVWTGTDVLVLFRDLGITSASFNMLKVCSAAPHPSGPSPYPSFQVPGPCLWSQLVPGLVPLSSSWFLEELGVAAAHPALTRCVC